MKCLDAIIRNYITTHIELRHILMCNASNFLGVVLPDFEREAYYLSTSVKQEKDWIKRHNTNPLLTVKDLMLVDRIVEEVMIKHTGCKGKDLNIFNLYKDIL